jgi:elongator complex protein 1
VNVGWGSKSTQFHGSAGKAAAASPAPSTAVAGRSPDDDGLPRVSWRADGAFFCVSSLSPSPASDTARRVLRVYDRAAALHATSESTAGLEHAVAWRPAAGGAGQLLAGTQRFGARAGLAPGREGRHDVVLFERNGLRHGEFALRPAKSASIPGAEAEAGRVWGYRVRDLAWSADGGVLAVWIERDEGDAGKEVSTPFRRTLALIGPCTVQLWTTGNYHWCTLHRDPYVCALTIVCVAGTSSTKYLRRPRLEATGRAGSRPSHGIPKTR